MDKSRKHQVRLHNYKLKGRTYKPEGGGKFPAVIICHGYPGDSKNMGLAEELSRV